MHTRTAARIGCFLALALSLLPASASRAERAWVKDEVRLNVRTGAGVQYRILGAITTGDSVEVISHTEGWTQVRAGEGVEGWIPEGFLQEQPPARVRLERFEADTAEQRARLDKLSSEVEELRTQRDELGAASAEQKTELDRLTRENLELRAGARWPEWIAGASILFVGAVLGWIVHRSATRRPGPRIRL
jgi:SH3 domain protein